MVSVRAFSRSVRARQGRFTSPPCRRPPGQSAGIRQAHPRTKGNALVLMSSGFVSTRQQQFACARLPDPHLTARRMPFLDSSPQQTSPNVARRGLKPPPAGRLRRATTFITRTAPITRRPITYLSIGLLSLFGTHASAKSSYEPEGGQRQEWRSCVLSQAGGDVRVTGQPQGVDRQGAQAGEDG